MADPKAASTIIVHTWRPKFGYSNLLKATVDTMELLVAATSSSKVSTWALRGLLYPNFVAFHTGNWQDSQLPPLPVQAMLCEASAPEAAEAEVAVAAEA